MDFESTRSFYLFIYFRLHWVFVAARRLSLAVVSEGFSSLRCVGFSLRWLLLLWRTGSKRMSSVVVVHGLSCSVTCGIFRTRARTRVPCIGRWILFFIIIIYFILFIYGCVGSLFLCEGFLQLWQAGGHSSSRCAGPSLSRPLLLRSTGSRRAGSVIVRSEERRVGKECRSRWSPYH